MITIEPCRFESRVFPFTEQDVAAWMDEIPEDHRIGLSVIITDAGMGAGPRPSEACGQYLKSAARRIKTDPSGLIKLYTVKVRYLKRGPVYTHQAGTDHRSWVPEEMQELETFYRFTLRHEVGHYLQHRLGRLDSLSRRRNEIEADAYASNPQYVFDMWTMDMTLGPTERGLQWQPIS